ncbi:MAG: AMP-binding protein [Saprospiraceae bacterium]
MNVFQIFQAAAAQYPGNVAIIEKDKQITFGALLNAVEKTAAQMKAEGLKPGDRVLVFVPMGIDLYRIVLALFKIGATAVFLDEWVSWKRMELCCELADCKGFVGIWKARVMGWFSKPIRQIPIKPRIAGYAHFAADAETFPAAAEHPALITFTTGSTGVPKAALRSHGFLRKQFEVLQEEIQPQPGGVDMTVLPIVLLINLGAGATSVIAQFKASKPDALKAGDIVRQIQTHGVRRITASPFFVRKLAEHCIEHNLRLGFVEAIFTGGAPVFPVEAQTLRKAFPGAAILIAYGSTEAEPISLVSADEVAQASGTEVLEALPVGRLNRHATVKIIPVTDGPIQWPAAQPLQESPPGAVGEIIVSGPHVLAAYFNNPEALRRNKIVAPDGTLWHRTGDSGFLKNGDQLFLAGRCSTLFEHHGKLICPFLYESWLQQLKGVEMGTVLSRNGAMLFCLEAQSGADLNLIRRAIAGLNIPVFSVQFLAKIPRDPRHHSKIDYARLLEIL